jgi:serine protease Do
MKMKFGKKLGFGIAVSALVGFVWAYGHGNVTAAKSFILPTSAQSSIAQTSVPNYQAPMVPGNFSRLAKQAQPGVVNIRTVKTIKGGGPVFRHFFGNPFDRNDRFGGNDRYDEFFGPFSKKNQADDFKQQSLGSGFIMSPDGYIVTNNHVIENADEIKVKLADGKEFDARLVGRDPKTDLALIKIKASSDLVPLKMGDSDKLEIGSWVVAIGSPFGLEQTVTAGIVSAKGRVIGAGPYDDFIQTDASINPGNSGGPLLNMNGEVIGINTAIIAQGQGIGFAIPINLAQGIVTQLQNNGTVTRGWLGVGIQDLTPALSEYYGIKDQKGVLVTQVYKEDPADKAGMRPNDIIVAVDGKPVDSSHELSTIIAGLPVGNQTQITILRDGKEKTLDVQLAKRQDSEPIAKQDNRNEKSELGLQVKELNPESARQLGFAEDEKGVLVVDVQPGGKAEQAGIRQGDLVKEVNRKPVRTVDGLTREVEKAKDGKAMQLLVKRPNAGYVVIKIV